MCTSLPAEFWDGWKWSTGDMCKSSADNHNRLVVLVSSGADVAIKPHEWVQVAYPYAICGCNTETMKLNTLTPLPRLAQLLKIATSRDNSPIAFFTLSNFKGYVDYQCEQDHGWPLKFSTLEQMALCYVMWLKYEFIWTCSAWGPVD